LVVRVASDIVGDEAPSNRPKSEDDRQLRHALSAARPRDVRERDRRAYGEVSAPFIHPGPGALMRHVRAFLVAGLVVLMLASASLALAATKNVGVKKVGSRYHWNPTHLTIRKGDTVRWSWRGHVPHNVTGPGFHSTTTDSLTYSRKFTKAGTYTVVCTIHQALGQRMKITVR
jgi:plastocyanin